MRPEKEGLPNILESKSELKTAAHWRVDIEPYYTMDNMAANHKSMTSKGSFQGKNLFVFYIKTMKDPTRDEFDLI